MFLKEYESNFDWAVCVSFFSYNDGKFQDKYDSETKPFF